MSGTGSSMAEADAGGSLQHLSDQAVEIAKRRQQAAVEVLQLLEKGLQPAVSSHPESVLYAAAWLAGTSLYRSFGYAEEAASGTIMLSEKANQEWPKLMKVLMFLLDKEGIKLKQDELILEIPAAHSAKTSILQIQAELQAPFNEIMKRNGFDYAEGAKTGAVVCAMLIKVYCLRRKDLEPGLAAGIVSMGFVEGAKTSPAPLTP